jgi:hypothetical protein
LGKIIFPQNMSVLSEIMLLPPPEMSESESSCQLSIGCKVSEEHVANIKDESKEDKGSEEIEPSFGDVRFVHYFLCTVNIGV